MAFGVTPAGFKIPQLTDVKQEMNDSLKSSFGANVDLSSSAPLGQIVGTVSEVAYKIWAAAQDVYNSEYPNSAFGVSLDNVGSISGVKRLGALPSTVLGVKLFGTAGTVVAGAVLPTIATQFSVQGSPGSIFQLDGTVTLGAGQSCIQTIVFTAVPDSGQWQLSLGGRETSILAFNADAAAVQVAIRELLFAEGSIVTGDYSVGFTVTFDGAGTGGLMSQPQFLTPLNTLEASSVVVDITTAITQEGIDQASVNVTATNTGPIIANAGTLTVINTPVSGLDAVLNVTDAIQGRDAESDNAYRARRNTSLQVAGAGTFEAIRSRLLQLTGVTSVVMFENVDDVVDVEGLPPHSFEATVQGGDNTAIGDLLWQIKPAGIRSFGSIHVVVNDSQGQPHTVEFSRPVALTIYVIVQLMIDPILYPLNGDAAVRQAIVDFGNSLGIGKDVIVNPYMFGAISGVPGIDDAVILIGTSPVPTLPDNIAVAANEIATFDTSRVSITHV